MTSKTKLWCDQVDPSSIGRLSARCKDLINIAWFRSTKDLTNPVHITAVRDCLLVDISQDISRRPWSNRLGTFTTSAQIYSFRLGRVLLEEEKFYFLGFPRNTKFSSLSMHALRDLSGDAMALPSVTMVIYSLLLVGRFPGLWSN